MKKCLLLNFILFIATFAFANNNPAFEIKFKSGKFIPEVTTNFEEAIKPQLVEKNQKYIYRLIQFYTIPTNAEKQRINGAGIELLSYIPNKAFFAKLQKGIEKSDLVGLNIRSILSVEEHYKLSPLLTKKELPAWAMSGNDIQLNVKYYSKEDEATLIDFIAEKKGEVIARLEKVNILVVQYSATAINDLARNPLIQWIEPISPPSTPDSNIGKGSTRSNALNTSYNGGRKYDGSGVAIVLADDGLIGPHIDFEGRATMHTTVNAGTHGDMTSGICVGAGNLDPTIGGMAPGADIHIFKIGTSIFLSSNLHIQNAVENMNTLGTVITSTSYSQGTGGVYNTTTEFTDQQINETPIITHVFAAGNSGQQDHDYGAGSGWGNIAGGMKAGKNVICVGNVDENDELIINSSRGPAADGRIKPDLCALGAGHLTTDENNTYQVGTGTSASTPAIAGVVAQLYQAYKEHNGGQEPESGFIKATLMNTAEDLGNPGPDFKHGWGRINGLKAVRIIEDNRYLTDIIEQDVGNSHVITVPDNVSQVRIMTYWIDVEGNPSSAVALVNDINMQVITPNAEMYNPLILDPTPNATNLNADAIQGIDDLNNVEQVTIDNPIAGDYTVNLNGFAIPQGPQKYYVLYDFIFDEVELIYPIGGEGFVLGETETIWWDASTGTEDFILEYSTDGGSSFINIGTAASTDRRYDWTVPNVLSSDVKFKISRGNSSSESDTTFTIVNVPGNLNILRVCPDTIEFGWDNVDDISMYEVSMLGDKYMDSIGISTTNTFIVTGLNPNDDHWFSVRSIVSGSKGRRAIAINKPPGTENCILNQDIEMTQLLSPIEGGLTTCRDLENTAVSLNITNAGLEAASNIDLNYQINNGTVVTESFSGNLMSGENTDYTFATPTDLSGLSNFEIAIWVSFTTDENYFNDTIRTAIKIFDSNLVSTFPFSENFQSFTNCSVGISCELVECPLINGWINYTNLEEDDIDWRTDTGGTGTTNTGPETDYDNGTSTGKYLYLEGSQGCNFREAVLFSPCIDLTTANCAEFEFAYHMYGVNMGELHVDIYSGSGEFLDVVSPIIGNQGNQWNLLNVDLAPFIGEIINVKIRGTIGNGVRSDMAIDAMTFTILDAVADFTFDIGTTANTILFTNNSSGSVDNYLWDFGDNNTSSEANPTYEYQNPGIYNVTLIIMGSCGSDTIAQTIMVGSTSAYNLNDLVSKIDIYPNPTNSNFTIQFPQQLSNQDVKIKLMDVVGKEFINITNDGKTKLSVDASEFPSGLFFIEITTQDFKVVKKIVIQ